MATARPPQPTGGALRRLVDGFDRFRDQHFENDHELYDALLDGQQPEVMVIACSDSRTDPAIICGAEPGDLFVVRNVAALVPTYEPDHRPRGTSATIEFGVVALGVRHVIVLGHSFCAGVRCLLEHDHGGRRFDFVSDWVGIASEVRDEMDGLVTEAEQPAHHAPWRLDRRLAAAAAREPGAVRAHDRAIEIRHRGEQRGPRLDRRALVRAVVPARVKAQRGRSSRYVMPRAR